MTNTKKRKTINQDFILGQNKRGYFLYKRGNQVHKKCLFVSSKNLIMTLKNGLKY